LEKFGLECAACAARSLTSLNRLNIFAFMSSAPGDGAAIWGWPGEALTLLELTLGLENTQMNTLIAVQEIQIANILDDLL
jgi:hypothetical protein